MEKKERNPRHLTAADVKVGVLRVDAQGVKLRVWPKPERIRSILDELYSPEGWYMTLYRQGWVTLDSKQYDTLEEARAAYNKILFKSDYRIAEAYTVVRYKPVK